MKKYRTIIIYIVALYLLCGFRLWAEPIYLPFRSTVYKLEGTNFFTFQEMKDISFLGAPRQALNGFYAFDAKCQDFAFYDCSKEQITKKGLISKKKIETDAGSFSNAYVLDDFEIVISNFYTGGKGFKTAIYDTRGSLVNSFYCPLFSVSCIAINKNIILAGGTQDNQKLKIIQVDVNTAKQTEIFSIPKDSGFLALVHLQNKVYAYKTMRSIVTEEKRLYSFTYKKDLLSYDTNILLSESTGLCFFGYPAAIGDTLFLPVAQKNKNVVYTPYNVITKKIEPQIPLSSGSTSVYFTDENRAIILGFHYFKNPNEFSFFILNSGVIGTQLILK